MNSKVRSNGFLKILKGTIVFIMLTGMLQPDLFAFQHTETIQQTLRFQDPADAENSLKVYNIQGDVIVEGHPGEEVIVVAEKTIKARRQSDIDRGRNEMQLVFEEEGNTILIYADAPFIHVRKRDGDISYNMNSRDIDYEFQIDITIKVPEQVKIYASTINNGRVAVENITAREITAANVNGMITLNGISGKTRATTVNGDIKAIYTESPSSDSKYQTVNGTIEVMYPENLSANIRFKSLHGDLYTDFENIEHLNSRLEISNRSSSKGAAYRVDGYSPLRIGSGGPEFSFEVLNGDVYIRQIKS